MEDSDVSDGHGTQEMCSDEVQTLPILQKFEQLSNQVQNLKKEHTELSQILQSRLVDSNRIATKIRSASGLDDPARVNWKSNPSRPCPNCQHIIDNSDA
ncbi:SUPPRESSOR OF GAMMA RESPONSE 1 [Camellia lanceoleosa]|uniref:SUPPRESSOR OF GAMMA RESPONSE 1 n=1 Tax=Camellia lanceoleosa TaxID=1840588 RepID=A0ACC0G9J4_9ERIC|nr:SUPPRESSOR OF GAMMA RESPONSE 1 [Camellia lanceoleosa]